MMLLSHPPSSINYEEDEILLIKARNASFKLTPRQEEMIRSSRKRMFDNSSHLQETIGTIPYGKNAGDKAVATLSIDYELLVRTFSNNQPVSYEDMQYMDFDQESTKTRLVQQRHAVDAFIVTDLFSFQEIQLIAYDPRCWARGVQILKSAGWLGPCVAIKPPLLPTMNGFQLFELFRMAYHHTAFARHKEAFARGAALIESKMIGKKGLLCKSIDSTSPASPLSWRGEEGWRVCPVLTNLITGLNDSHLDGLIRKFVEY